MCKKHDEYYISEFQACESLTLVTLQIMNTKANCMNVCMYSIITVCLFIVILGIFHINVYKKEGQNVNYLLDKCRIKYKKREYDVINKLKIVCI